MGPIETRMREYLSEALSPSQLEITNESPQHGLPAAAEKHFRVVAVSSVFTGLNRLERHRRIQDLLQKELKSGQIHALSVQAFTEEEWQKRGGSTHASPECLGGGKREGIGRR